MKKLRTWDSKALADGYVVSAQFKQHIKEIYGKLNTTSISELPPSLIPSEILYELVCGFGIMYNNLVNQDLLNTGNKKQERNNSFLH